MKRKQRRITDDRLEITSMMDMMTIILVFLLKSFSASEVNVVPSDKLQLPNSSSRVKPEVAVTVMVRKDQILVDNEPLEFQLVTYEDPLRPGQVLVAVPDDQKESAAINDLYNRLNEFAKADEEIAKRLEQKGVKKRKDLGSGKILLQIDKDIPFSLLKEVMFTAGQAKFNEFEFVVVRPAE
jgi:biopolymer transport protein ExbD